MMAAGAASAQSPSCAAALRQATAQSGAARTAALRRVAANCPNDSAGRRAAQLAGPGAPTGPSAAQLEQQRRERERQERLVAEQRQRDREERIAAEQRQRDREQRIAEEQRQRDRERRIAEEQRQRDRERQIAEDARRRREEEARRTTTTDQRPIVALNRCNVPVRFRLVYSYRGTYSRVDTSDVAWTVEPNDTRTLVYRNIDVTSDNPVMYFHIVSPNWTYPETTRRTFEYGGVNLEMYGTTTSVNENGAYQIVFC